MTRKTHKKSFALACALFVAAALSGCDTSSAKANAIQEGPAPLPVAVATAERSDLNAIYTTTMTLESEADAVVPAKVKGEVIGIFVEEGDRVQAGQVLARLDGARLRLAMQEARANLEKARREYARTINLHERGLVSSAAFDAMSFDLESLQAAYELAALELRYTEIVSPIDGVVGARDINIGQNVNAGDAAFRVTNTDELVAHLQIPQTELARFAAGHPLTVAVDARPDVRFEANIARISPTIDKRTGTFRATAYIDNKAGLLAPGMFGRFSIAYEIHKDTLVVPSAAVIDEDSETIVYVINEGAAERRVIRTGISERGFTEVVAGLEENERVIVSGHSGLRDGSRVLASNVQSGSVSG